ncbi:hypothetical protein GXM_07798 [Nostoc sphaeroides CCNUC1]|uniref:Uncharacterized protein n=1 Tax=Nostoc sphaeroides CCNUC1 TaxID=2653204 RepID=A0A5P8WCF1_9NOSO|nr:hypothetical protein GXM_07798 [Nostoc sphaeroides CCNUC1]
MGLRVAQPQLVVRELTSQNNSKFKIINFIINTPRINAGA